MPFECPLGAEKAIDLLTVQGRNQERIGTLEKTIEHHLTQHDRFYWLIFGAIALDIMARFVKMH